MQRLAKTRGRVLAKIAHLQRSIAASMDRIEMAGPRGIPPDQRQFLLDRATRDTTMMGRLVCKGMTLHGKLDELVRKSQ